ncbi:MAG: sigma-70 family RNA polymerase sigma factor [Myxococcales bacterium]|nr:sigma-70 family RNA polymerase sigma factor [Myxococcales bacterium]MDD9965091.1 sigma-70 family RNA polymerase sigma factor [Myxococcales bacterium]
MQETDLEGSEREFRQACAAGRHDDAVALIFERYGVGLLRFLADRLPSRADAEDVLSDVAVKMLSAVPTLDLRCSARAWAYTVARNAAIDFHRRPHRRPGRNMSLTSPEAAGVAQQLRTTTAAYLKTSVKNRFRELRQQLPEEDQTVLVLRLDRGFSWDEIAAVTLPGTSGQAQQAETARLRQRFKRAKDKLQALATREGLLD